jgi:hypothetical protein
MAIALEAERPRDGAAGGKPIESTQNSGRRWYDRRVTPSRRRAFAVVLVAGLFGCTGASEEEVQRKFNDYVNGANTCTMASECAAASAGCPLGCEVAVRTERVADVEAKAQQLIAEYERGGRSCIYGCRGPGTVACVVNRCAIQYDSPADGSPRDGP